MATRLGAFNPKKEDITEYLRRFGHFLRPRNMVVGPDAGQAAVAERQKQLNLRLPWFISEIGSSAYRIIVDMCAPVEPDEKTFEDLTAMLRQYYSPARNVNDQRSEFQSRKQQLVESVNDFAIALRHLARHCSFQSFLDAALQTQLISGLRNAHVKDKMTEGTATFSALVERAIQAEVAYDPQEPAQASATVNWVPKRRYIPAKQKTANTSTQGSQMQDIAQSQQKFPKPSKEEPQENEKGVRYYYYNQRRQFANWCPLPKKQTCKRQNWVEQSQSSEGQQTKAQSASVNEPLDIYKVSSSGFRAVITVKLNGTPLEMELDTGAKAIAIDAGMLNALFKGQKLRPTPALLWGIPLKTKGEFDVLVEYQGHQAKLPLCVTERSFLLCPGYLGLDTSDRITRK
jgi:hypothetical protein